MIYFVTRGSAGELKKLTQLAQRMDINPRRILQLHRTAQSAVKHPLRNIQRCQLGLFW
jgi:hypothetical protein